MGHYSVRKKIRRRKVANLASISRRFTVKHTVDSKKCWANQEELEKIPTPKWKKERHKVPKGLHHSYKYWDAKLQKYVKVKSTYPEYSVHHLTRQELLDGYIKAKLEKWERKHPCPAKNDDLFKDEFIPQWKAQKEEALKRITNIVRSRYDNDIRLHAKYEDSSGYDKQLAKVKDENGEVTKETSINCLDPKKSQLIKKAQKITNAEKKKNPKLVATNLRDHKGKKGRIVLPKAA